MENKQQQYQQYLNNGRTMTIEEWGKDGRYDPNDKPEYINQELKPVSKEHLKNVLKELHDKHQEQRREDNRAVADALNSGFYCTGGRSNIKPLI